MARIRTVKPEIWTDEKFTECSLGARLLFIGMLNYADDNGNQANSAKRLKMQIFPGDELHLQPLLDELIAQGVVIEYSVSDHKFLHIKGFRTHQVINHPSLTRIPQPALIEPSLSAHGVLPDGREGKGKERNKEANASVARASLPTCPTQSVIDLYHEVLPELPAVRLLNDARKKGISNFWKFALTSKRFDGTSRANDAESAMAWIREYFELARENDFLMGRGVKSGTHENWTCDIDFLLSEKGKKHVIEKTKDAS
ncbi:hypothetical protein [Polaromonas sp.]|uniref:hypothetical protein n=1 Tax=Polaromonas sp. TaxID=1869339 RepID=UPI0017A70480|nr:hypothetical protein [Polaromonas sp.]NMM06017.1 hypothetical protein [Polaromonas sp.]